jgi:two-component system chemotaxis response regulator CheY
MRVLIVDDDSNLRRILSLYLGHAGYEVMEAANGQAAWELWQNDPIRLIVTDWMMPVMDGQELVRRLRAASTAAGYCYIIMLTARTSKGDVVLGLESGADDYLTKPFDSREFRARVGIGQRILDLEGKLKDARHQLEILAMHDGLTNLLNRRAIHAHAESELSLANRQGAPVSLLLLDIDHFKLVNDHYGHAVGDQALRYVADLLLQKKRPYDWAGRWGGEEFLLVLPKANLEEAARVAERLRVSVETTPLTLADGREVSLRLSLGVSSTEGRAEGGLSVNQLLQQADEALYAAKAAGRNLVKVYQELRQEKDEDKDRDRDKDRDKDGDKDGAV